MQQAMERAMGAIALHVEPDNPAKKLYEALGLHEQVPRNASAPMIEQRSTVSMDKASSMSRALRRELHGHPETVSLKEKWTSERITRFLQALKADELLDQGRRHGVMALVR